ncbi:MAG: PIG-L family deacetylase [Bifidobacteriaceae bacterium]|jgi:LmbE family N-acetylglucosaminyl deacetylase|nr:PIG-L family deacetylase [Bifidobacteriaceae bacterium]
MRNALVVMAHPDDVDFWAAGAVALWVDAGVRVTYLIVTGGGAGGFEAGSDRGDMSARRRAEQRRAAGEVGVRDIRFLDGFEDGEVTPGQPLVRAVTRAIRDVKPDLVLTQSPTRAWHDIRLSHPDHLATGEAAARAVYPFARNPFAFPKLLDEGLDAFEVRELWLQGDPEPNHPVDVTRVWDRREAALAAHVSQHQDLPAALARARREAAAVAAKWGLPPGALAEEFRRVPITD